MSAPRPFAEYRDTPLWDVVAAAVAELETTKEIAVHTAPDYVIGYLCQELAVKWLVASSALTRPR